MHYFVLEEAEKIEYTGGSAGYAENGTEKLKIIKMADLSPLYGVDYISKKRLVSDRLKMLLEMYLPKQGFNPVVFWNPQNMAQTPFWTFEPPFYEDCEVIYRSDSVPQHINFCGGNVPIAFSVPPRRGCYSSIVSLAIAESILRRGILGLKLTRLTINNI